MTEKNMETKLKPCPFCGLNLIEIVKLHEMAQYVRCKNPKCIYQPSPLMIAMSKKIAIDSWNTRHKELNGEN